MLHSNLREIGMKYKFKTGQLWMLLIFVCSYLLYTNEMERRSKANDALLSSERSESMAITMTESTENYAVYSKYPLSSPYIRGVVLLFHGCGHLKESWMNLPYGFETVSILNHEFDLATIAFSPTDRQHKCWDGSMNGEDYAMVKKSLLSLLEKYPKLRGRYMYAIGASSGGSFVCFLPSLFREIHLPLKGLSVIISPGRKEEAMKKIRTTFITMLKDDWASMSSVEATANAVFDSEHRENYFIFPSIEKTSVFEEFNRVIYDKYLEQIFTESYRQRMELLKTIMNKQDLIDSAGYLKSDPRRTFKTNRVVEEYLNHFNDPIFEARILEILNFCWA